MSVLAQIAIFPLGEKESLAPAVAKAVDVVAGSGLSYQVGPMGTCVEGNWSEVMAVVNGCFEALKADHHRIYLSLTVDYRADREGGLTAKVAAVETLMRSSA
jgi:uncharacterized protein (TIGR00106 family)